MSVEELEKAIEKLPASELARFRAWFEQFSADRWDRQMDADAANGKFDKLVGKSDADFKAGRFREI
ncbi:MAG TPA: hypothetical protein VG309_12255 [Rhizomicrobium sp.]|jgi:hypothetical protein|nr:hypothetical protein [Rhizomicrobium sp.]